MAIDKVAAIGCSVFGGKIKNVYLILLFVFGFFLIFGIQKVSAAIDCGTQTFKPDFKCTDVLTLVNKNACVTGHCSGDNNNQCCPKNAAIKSITGTSNPVSTDPTKFVNPLRFTNVEQFLGGIMVAIQRIIVALALVFIMIGAVMILTSAGSSGMVEKGKAAITMALVGLALGVAAPSLLKELANIVGWGGAEAVKDALTLTQIAMKILNFLLGTMGILALVMMVIGASMYLTSAGDDDRIKKGKDIFKYSLLGVVLAMSSMVLVTQIAKFFTN